MIIAIDFDGTIVEHAFPGIGALLPSAKEIINQLKKEGHYIIIWSCRGASCKKQYHDMIDFLKDKGIQFDQVNSNCPELDFHPFPKIYADVYIDDKNLQGFPGWEKAYDLIYKHDRGINYGDMAEIEIILDPSQL